MIIPKPPKGAAHPRGHTPRSWGRRHVLPPHGPPACAGLDIGWGLSFLGLASLALGYIRTPASGARLWKGG